MSAPANQKYLTTNWKDYNVALKARGSLLIWLDKEICWHGSASGKRGRSPKYSESAIQLCLTIKGQFNLALGLIDLANLRRAPWPTKRGFTDTFR